MKFRDCRLDDGAGFIQPVSPWQESGYAGLDGPGDHGFARGFLEDDALRLEGFDFSGDCGIRCLFLQGLLGRDNLIQFGELLPLIAIQYTDFRFTACGQTVAAFRKMRGVVDIGKEGGQGIEILHFEWIKLMLVTLGTSHGGPHPYFRQISHPVSGVHGNVFLGLNPAFVGGLEQTIVSGGNNLIGGGLGE